MSFFQKSILFQSWREPSKISNKRLSKAVLLLMLLSFSHVTFGLDYCDSASGNRDYEQIDSVTVNNIIKQNLSSDAYIHIQDSGMTLIKGASNEISIAPLFGASSYNEYYKIWVDLDSNGVFDSNEQLFNTSTDSVALGSIFIPANTSSGVKRMRVIQNYEGITSACGDFSYGQVVDIDIPVQDEWIKCADEGEVCFGTSDNIDVTIRYGIPGKWAYRYNEVIANNVGISNDIGVSCNNAFNEFGDPAPGSPKSCYYKLEKFPDYPGRDPTAPIQTLHSVTDDSAEEFYASTLIHYGSLVSPDGNSELLMQPDGQLVIWSGGQATWISNPYQSNSNNDRFTFHVVHNGIEIRRNNSTVVWSAYPPGGAANTNYLLSIDNNGQLTLNDLENGIVRWRVSNGTDEFRNDPLSESTIESLYGKAGWVHTADWDSNDHNTFNTKHNGHSHWRMHEFYQNMTHGLKKVGAKIDDVVVDAWDEAVAFEEKAASAIHYGIFDNILNNIPSSRAVDLATGISGLVTHLDNGNLDLGELIEDEMAKFADGTLLQDEHSEIIAAVDDITLAEGRKLQTATTATTCNQWGAICTWLSQPQNAGKRLDYALEIDPTAVNKMFSKGGFIDASAGWVDQLQFRLFFTHPRLDAAGRYSTQIRLRLLDYAGYYGSAGMSSNYGALDFSADAGLVTIRDIILPYTWDTNKTFSNGREFQGIKYLALTGAMAEAAIDGSLNISEIKKSASAKVIERLNNVILLIEDNTATEVVTLNFGETISYASGLGGAQEVDLIMNTVNQLPSKFSGNIGFETGVGITPAAFYFDLNEMRDLALSKNYPPALASVGFHMFTIIITEILGEAGIVAAGIFAGLDEAEAAEAAVNWGAGLSLVNSELMLGGLIGDALYYGVHRKIFGKTDAVSMSAEAFWWGAGKLGLAINTPGVASKADELFDTSGHSSGAPIKLRMQINGSWWAHEYWSSGNNRLKSYGSFQLKTKNGSCIKSRTYYIDAVQVPCMNKDKFYWMAKPFGAPEENTYQLRSQFDNKCITTDHTTVLNGTRLSVQACDSSLNQRFKVRRLAGKMTFTSILNDTKCFDDTGGTSDIHMWTCDLKNQNQYFTVDYSTGIDVASWFNLKSSGAIAHTIRAKDATNCIGYLPSASAVLQTCNTNLSGNNSNHTFYLVNKNDGYFKILASHTDATIVSSNRIYLAEVDDNVAEFVQYSITAETDWEPLVQDDGSVKLKNRSSGLCMQHENGGMFVRECRSKKDADQKFIINIDKYNLNGGYD